MFYLQFQNMFQKLNKKAKIQEKYVFDAFLHLHNHKYLNIK
jgi:hypothetical protein